METRRCKLHVWLFWGGVGEESGGDARTRNLPLTEIYKGIFAQVSGVGLLAFAKSSFCAYIHFRMKSTESL